MVLLGWTFQKPFDFLQQLLHILSISSQLSLPPGNLHTTLKLVFYLHAPMASGTYHYHKRLSIWNQNTHKSVPLDISFSKTRTKSWSMESPACSRIKSNSFPWHEKDIFQSSHALPFPHHWTLLGTTHSHHTEVFPSFPVVSGIWLHCSSNPLSRKHQFSFQDRTQASPFRCSHLHPFPAIKYVTPSFETILYSVQIFFILWYFSIIINLSVSPF